ncbi:MAG: PAS domain S-box protein [Chloroflexota bacterium]|nr:PAS domain S-box protein [Chloroflexota bacterium]
MSIRATAASSPGASSRPAAGTIPAIKQPRIEAAGFGVWQWSVASSMVTLSPTAAAAHGITTGSFAGTLAAFGDLIHPDDRDRSIAAFFQAFASGGDRFVEYRTRWPDGSIQWIVTWVSLAREDHGGPTGLVAVCLGNEPADHTDRLFRQAQQQLSMVLDGVTDGISVQAPTGDMVYGNAAAQRILGITTLAELQAIPFRERLARLASTDDAGQPIPIRDFPTIRALRGERPNEMLVQIQPLDGGERRWVTLKSTPITDDQGHVRFIVNRFRDMTEERRRQAELRDSEARYRLLFESNPIPMWVWDTRTFRFLAVNDAAIYQYGWPREEFLRLTLLDVRPPEDQPAILDKIARVAAEPAGLDVAGVWRHRRRDGTIFDAEVTTHAMTFNERDARVSLAIDVTERTLHERRLERLSALTAALSAALDPGEVARVIGEYATIAGADAAAVIAYTDAERTLTVLHRTGPPAPAAAGDTLFSVDEPTLVGHVIQTGQAIIAPTWDGFARLHPELVARRQIAPEIGPGAGLVLPLLVDERPIGALKMAFRDPRPLPPALIEELRTIAHLCAQALQRAQLYAAEHTARATAEVGERVARREADRIAIMADLSRAQAEAGLDVQAVLDAVARTTARHTGDACAIALFRETGDPVVIDTIHHAEPALQAVLQGFMAVEWRPHIQETAARVAATGEAELSPVIDVSLPVPGPAPESGDTRRRVTLHSAMILPFRAHGHVTGAMALLRLLPDRPYTADDLAFFQELGDRAALALENARLYHEAREAVRARDEFLSAAAHELRTPVTTIKGYAQMLQRTRARGRLSSDRAAQFLQAIDESTDRLRILTDDLLDVSRLRLGQMPLRLQSLDLLPLVGKVIDRYRDQFGLRYVFSSDPLPAPAVVNADPDRIEQVLTNLLENATKYSPAGGEIRTTVAVMDSGVRISVRDSGIGLPAEDVERIFEPFNRAANAIRDNLPGLGLGLYICDSIVRRHGGHIVAESAGEGQGTTFHVWLPADSLATVRTESV